MSGDRLRPEDIRYLALEGGGGKGFAYLGALQLLDDHKVLDQIKGVAGASAGAITALMISLGMSATEIGKKIDETDFTEFFDDPLPRLIPRAQIGTYQSSMAWPYAYVYPQDNEKELLMELYLGAPDVFNNFLNYLQDKDNSGGILSLPSWIILPGIRTHHTCCRQVGKVCRRDGLIARPAIQQTRAKLPKVLCAFAA